MKKTLNYLLILLLVAVTINCKAQKKSATINNSLFKPDSIVAAYYGKEALAIMYSPDKVFCYTLKNDNKKDSPSVLLDSCFIVKQKIGIVDESYYSILQFLFQNTSSHKFDNTVNKCFFTPYIAFEFIKKKEKVLLLLSFTCENWAIYHKGKTKMEKFAVKKDLINFVMPIFPKDKYIQQLK